MSIIKKPIITEKMTNDTELFNRYAFVVDRKANKNIVVATKDIEGPEGRFRK